MKEKIEKSAAAAATPSSPFATVGIKKLRIDCVIGVEKWERLEEQPLFVDLSVVYDVRRCAKSDALEDGVDYRALADLCREVAVEGRFQLIECYASQLLELVIARFPVFSAKIGVEKPGALKGASCSFIEMEITKPLEEL